MRDLEMQEEYMKSLELDLSDLKAKLLDVQLNINSFHGNDEKTPFYTGLPNFFIMM